ncbi:hypothetical protein BH24ACI3_BH24ACI3_02200 [soil metagenome]
MYRSRNKIDLMIEVWERLDCETVGKSEITAIENALTERFGSASVESPMKIARLLADEGAELRHAEIMTLYVERSENRPYDSSMLNLLDLTDLTSTARSLRQVENLRRKYEIEADDEGIRLLRKLVLDAKEDIRKNSGEAHNKRAQFVETAEWLTIWLGSPSVFENWLQLRIRSDDFIVRFGKIFH